MSLQKPLYVPTELVLKILAYLPGEEANNPILVRVFHSIYNNNKDYISYNILRAHDYICDLNIAYAMYKQLKRHKYILTTNNSNEFYLLAASNNHVELFTLIIQNSSFIADDEFLWSCIEEAGSADHVEIIKLLLTHPRIINQLEKISNDEMHDFIVTSRIFRNDKVKDYLISIEKNW